jgi:hypothetical protein
MSDLPSRRHPQATSVEAISRAKRPLACVRLLPDGRRCDRILNADVCLRADPEANAQMNPSAIVMQFGKNAIRETRMRTAGRRWRCPVLRGVECHRLGDHAGIRGGRELRGPACRIRGSGQNREIYAERAPALHAAGRVPV